ncbi:MAG TPA: Gfo/Idh/MocA family oxidoreductase, partial [Planctomycetota bacterium]|nr:Gfo/Idh/MocA family oxidoreductase [Planctomycetota bacterium]
LGSPDVRAVFVLTRHDLHAQQVCKALTAGKHVFVEKPLAISIDELEQIEGALLKTPEPHPLLMVGFNRRFSPAATAAKAFFAQVRQPLTVTLRMNAGPVPAEHWTQDEQSGGGRIIGEACHAIDLAVFLTGSLPVRVFAESVGRENAPAISDDQCLITLRHANGSISSIAYVSSGDKAFPKERVEIFGGGRVAVIDDFRELTTSVDGKQKTAGGWKQDKGHHAEIEAFSNVLARGGAAPIAWSELRTVTLASILAVRSLREGVPFEID